MTNIGIDIDEVLAETVKTFLTFYNNKYATNFAFEDATNYSFGEIFGITKQEELRAVQEFFASPLAINMPTVVDSAAQVEALSKQSKLFAVSSRPEQLMPLTSRWLNVHYPNCFEDIILTNSHVDASKTKSDVCRALNLSVFIDDQSVFAEDCAKVCEEVFLIDKPWNQGAIRAKNIYRVASWKEIGEKLRS